MKRFDLLTLFAVVVTLSIATKLLAVGALSPTTPITGLPPCARDLLDWLGRQLDRGIMLALARWGRRATIVALNDLDERILADIGLHRDGSVRC